MCHVQFSFTKIIVTPLCNYLAMANLIISENKCNNKTFKNNALWEGYDSYLTGLQQTYIQPLHC